MQASAQEFFEVVWPDTGWYCVATPYKDRGYNHYTFNTIAGAMAFAHNQCNGKNVFFAVHTLKDQKIWDPDHEDEHGTKIGKWRVRTKPNIKESRCFFFDLDVGSEKPFKTRAEALLGLTEFMKHVRLPAPWVVSSGGGFHVYWPLTKPIPSEEWVTEAAKLRRLAQRFEFGVDPMRVVDRTSILRFPGTFNLKTETPREVEVIRKGAITETDAFLDILKRASVFLAPAVGSAEHIVDTRDVDLNLVGKACGTTRALVRGAATQTEPQWYAMIGLMLYMTDGEKLIHKVSSKYPGYSVEETNGKIAQVKANQTGPTTCKRFAALGYQEQCRACWYKNPDSSPVIAAKRLGVTYTPDAEIPPPPKPWKRLLAGGVSIVDEEDGTETVISPYDVFPSQIIGDYQENTKLALWNAVVPHREPLTFTMPLRTVQDQPALGGALADQGIMLQYDDLKHMRRYMTSYIQELQRYQKEHRQHSHLGWTDDHSEFILPHQAITKTGSNYKPLISSSVAQAVEDVHRKGSLPTQVEALKFYNDPTYIRQQLALCAALAAPLFYMTDQYGVILSLSGESGASKSTTLYTGGSFWGRGSTYTINGTNRGMTANAQANRMAVLSNLPVLLDEVTYMDPQEARNMAMAVTQPNGRIGLTRDSKEKKRLSHNKSTIMIASMNGSFHEKISVGNVAGSAASMRVLELLCPKTFRHTKTEATHFVRVINENFGHIGPAFMEYVVKHHYQIEQRVHAMMDLIDTQGNVAQEERFYTALVATAIEGARCAKLAGLLPFDHEALLTWFLSVQLPQMRGVISTNYVDPLEQFMTYLNASAMDTLVVEQSRNSTGWLAPLTPRRELGIRFERDSKQVYASLSHLKTYCQRRSVQMQAMIDALEKLTGAERTKMSLGKGIPEYNLGQTRVLRVNLRAKEFSGAEITSVENKIVELRHGKKTEQTPRDEADGAEEAGA